MVLITLQNNYLVSPPTLQVDPKEPTFLGVPYPSLFFKILKKVGYLGGLDPKELTILGFPVDDCFLSPEP